MAENEMTYTIKDIVNLPANTSIEILRKVHDGFYVRQYLDTFSENELKRDIALEVLTCYINNKDMILTAEILDKIRE